MIFPSIDIMSGNAVQLIGGETKALDAGDPLAIARRFSMMGELAVIDLDAALGQGDNGKIVEQLVAKYPCRVGGGIRDYETAVRWLDRGAEKIIVGTAARPDLLRRLPRERVIAALDCRHGSVVVEGWKKSTGRMVEDELRDLRDCVGGFLVTFVEREGRLEGLNVELARRLNEIAGDAKLTVAGGVTTAEEIRQLDESGIDAQVGMAIYTGRLSLADAFLAPARFDTDGLIPTVVVDEFGTALGQVYSSRDSIAEALRLQRGVYYSRRRGLWIKGETSGNTQSLLRLDLDCDRDSLRCTVHQTGSFCHTGLRTCWGDDRGLGRLFRRLQTRLKDPAEESYTRRLFGEPDLLSAKIREEASELIEAREKGHIEAEAADVIYFTLVKLIAAGGSLASVADLLDSRSKRVTRRAGDAKPSEVSDESA